MFGNNNNNESSADSSNDSETSGFLKKKIIIFASFLVVISIIIGVVLFIFKDKFFSNNGVEENNGEENQIGTSTSLGQYQNHLGGDNNEILQATSTDDIKAETLFFGQFYKKEEINIEPAISKTELPLNIKADVLNYYDVNRKINLDQAIENLNNNGFAIIDNSFKAEADDFYGLYNLLSGKNIPILITDDFLVYYFQNIVKQAFKQIEKSYFYREFHNINKDFFNIANDRYRKMINKGGVKNDPLLEGERLEAAFFAVGLELLKPEEKQITNSFDENKFTEEESDRFNYPLPEYLEEQVKKEVKLIKEAKSIAKSPLMLYERDYKSFIVPAEYRKNSRLNNFYLAVKWMNSVFPLYYASDECPKCLLDKDDWMINFVAASLISSDLNKNQAFKNKWAKIYKTMAYFSGLRSDLIYLNYNKSITDILGDGYKIEEAFAMENAERDNNISKIQELLAQDSFAEIEGGINREDEELKPIIGLRLLTESYWPNEYLFGQLVKPNVTLYNGEALKKPIKTSCKEKEGDMRCRGIGLDIVNLIHDAGNKSDYFIENTNYQGYEEQIGKIKNQLSLFNTNSWYNNSYWSTLRLMESMFNYDMSMISFSQNPAWEERNFNSAVGSWINLQLPVQNIKARALEENISGLKPTNKCNKLNYIEPNLGLIKELKAQGNMLLNMMSALKFIEENAYIGNIIKDYNSNVDQIDKIVIKELQGEQLTDLECNFISRIATQFIVMPENIKDREGKSIIINLIGLKNTMVETIDGAKLLVAINKNGEDNILMVGPIFNYKE